MIPDTKPRIRLNADQKALKQKVLGTVGDNSTRAVSFKMSGTLVLTPFSERGDMFMLMEDDFKDLTTVKKSFTELRLSAEDMAETKFAQNGGATLEKIYDILAKLAKLSPSSRDKLMKRECELIEYFSFPRSFGKELFRKAKSSNKKTVIVADTPYPRSVTVNILSRCGYETCDEIVLPSEMSLDTTSPKAVYNAAVKKSGVPAAKLLHIGSDVEADVETPILGGSKALLLMNPVPLMVKSGRLRGFVEAKHVYDYDSPENFALHCIFGLYAAYFFDVPLNKVPQSDFCGDEYMVGAVVGGAVKASKVCEPKSDMERILLDMIEQNERLREGMDDMEALFHAHFDHHLTKFGYKNCGLPLEFLAKHSAVGDRAMLQKKLSPADFVRWTEETEDADVAPVYGKKLKQNGVSKLADKLFPPGTKVRNIADGMLVKIKSKGKI